MGETDLKALISTTVKKLDEAPDLTPYQREQVQAAEVLLSKKISGRKKTYGKLLRSLSPAGVLVCAIALGQKRVTNSNEKVRGALLEFLSRQKFSDHIETLARESKRRRIDRSPDSDADHIETPAQKSKRRRIDRPSDSDADSPAGNGPIAQETLEGDQGGEAVETVSTGTLKGDQGGEVVETITGPRTEEESLCSTTADTRSASSAGQSQALAPSGEYTLAHQRALQLTTCSSSRQRSPTAAATNRPRD